MYGDIIKEKANKMKQIAITGNCKKMSGLNFILTFICKKSNYIIIFNISYNAIGQRKAESY